MLLLDFPKRAASFTTIYGNPSVVSVPERGVSTQAIFDKDGQTREKREIFCDGLVCKYHDNNLFVFSDGTSHIQVRFLSNGNKISIQGYKLKKTMFSTNSEVQLLVSNEKVDGILKVSESGQKSFKELFSSNDYSRVIDVDLDESIVQSAKYDGDLSWYSFSIKRDDVVEDLLGCHRVIRFIPGGALIGETYDLEVGEHPKEGQICMAVFYEGYVTPLFGPNGELVTLYTDQHLAVFDSLKSLMIVGLCKVEDTDRLMPISWEFKPTPPSWGIIGEQLPHDVGSKDSTWFECPDGILLIQSPERRLVRTNTYLWDLNLSYSQDWY
jgi:hypothetical protein